MVGNDLPKSKRLLSTFDFSNLREKPGIVKGRLFRIFYKPNLQKGSGPRLGIAISKKVGKANKRNLIKRIVRDEFRKNTAFRLKGVDILVVGAPHIFKNERELVTIKKNVRLDFLRLLQSIN